MTLDAKNIVQTLTGAQSYTGTTTVTAGTLQLGIGGSLSSSSTMSLAANGTFDLNNFNQTIAGISGVGGSITTGTGTGGTLNVNVPAQATFTSGAAISGNGGVTRRAPARKPSPAFRAIPARRP